MIFETVFGHFGTVLRFGFDLETGVFRFCGVFWYHSNLMIMLHVALIMRVT